MKTYLECLAIVTILSSGLNNISLYPSLLHINFFMNKDVNKIYLHFTMLKGIFNHLFLIATNEMDKVLWTSKIIELATAFYLLNYTVVQ